MQILVFPDCRAFTAPLQFGMSRGGYGLAVKQKVSRRRVKMAKSDTPTAPLSPRDMRVATVLLVANFFASEPPRDTFAWNVRLQNSLKFLPSITLCDVN